MKKGSWCEKDKEMRARCENNVTETQLRCRRDTADTLPVSDIAI